jgi:hypothetical protein
VKRRPVDDLLEDLLDDGFGASQGLRFRRVACRCSTYSPWSTWIIKSEVMIS